MASELFLAGLVSSLLLIFSSVSLYQGFMFSFLARVHEHNEHPVIPTRPKDKLKTFYNDTKPKNYDRLSRNLVVEEGDLIYTRGSWHGAPIVIEEFKLVFFTQPKAGSTTWLHLFRRMMGYEDWNVEEYETLLPWNPDKNGINYLYHYNRGFASYVMTAPDWTRAIFVRDPKERLLSAYLDKGVRKDGEYLRQHCCPEFEYCWTAAGKSLQDFFDFIRTCDDDNWRSQGLRIDSKFWPYINFVGHMETVAEDAERLLRQIGAWEKYGESNWGKRGAIFKTESGGLGRLHDTRAREKLKSFVTSPELENNLEDFYNDDYRHPVLNFTKFRVSHD